MRRTWPRDFRKTTSDSNALLRLAYKKYPKLLEALDNRPVAYNEQLDYVKKREMEGDLFVIAPKSTLQIKRVEKDPEVIATIYMEGRERALELLDDLKAFLEL